MKAKKPTHIKVRFEDKLRQRISRDSFLQNKSQGQVIREALYSRYKYDPIKDQIIKTTDQ